jgi:SAM-dependent methyltransferase
MKGPNSTASTEDFEFEALSEAKNYRRAIISEFAPYLSGHVLEIGAGIGQTTEALVTLRDVQEILCIEPDYRFHDRFCERFPKISLLKGTAADLDPASAFDGALMVNVLEHIEEDLEELIRLHRILHPRQGHLCLLIPARQELYSKLDSHFGHFRRYSRTDLKQKLSTAGFEIKRLSYFNFIGYFAWAMRFRLFGSMTFDIDQVRFFDQRIFPPAHWLESRIYRPPIGQSILAIAQAC